jgi:putative membrane protein insertion efficiency factor
VKFLIICYQRFISPLFVPRCKYYPSCSHYALNALRIHGVLGLLLVVSRLFRCNPFSYGGVDEVPEKIFNRKVNSNVGNS